MAFAMKLLLLMIIQGTIISAVDAGKCPVQKYIQKHVCKDCWTREKAITFAKSSNQHRSGKACLVHVFEGSTDTESYRSEKDQCVLKEPVDGWMCSNVLSDNTDCIPVKNCAPVHDDRTEKEGRLYSPGINCKPLHPLKLSTEVEKCSRTCRSATSTSRALCRVSRAVASSSVCLVKGWFTLGFPCVGDVGVASILSEGCTPVMDFASDGCDELCWSVARMNGTSEDYNKVLDDHMCIVKETTENYRWLDAVRFQGRVVDKQKEILDLMDTTKNPMLEKEIERSLDTKRNLLTELTELKERYDRITYSNEGLLVVNSNSEYFMQKALKDGGLQGALVDLYKHLSGIDINSIYKRNSTFCTQKTFNLMNSYLAEGHLMMSIALELGDKKGPLPDLREYLDHHHTEYLKRCGCPPQGSAPYVVQASIQPLLDAIEGVVDIDSSSDMILTLLPFIKTNSFNDTTIIMRTLAGLIQAQPGNRNALIKQLALLKTQIEEKSFKVCTGLTPFVPTLPPTTPPPTQPPPTTQPRPTCDRHSHCMMYKENCWCHHKYSNREQREACGYESNYSGEYYSIVSSGTPRDLILAMELTPDPNRCSCNEHCVNDCATNNCYDNGCTGTDLSCWNDHDRWARKYQGIVRCRNYE